MTIKHCNDLGHILGCCFAKCKMYMSNNQKVRLKCDGWSKLEKTKKEQECVQSKGVGSLCAKLEIVFFLSHLYQKSDESLHQTYC